MKGCETGEAMAAVAKNSADGDANPSRVHQDQDCQTLGEEERAFSRLVQVTSPAVYRFLVRMVRSPEDALDLTQEVFLAAHKNRHRLPMESAALPYLLTIARRRAVSLLRWRRVRALVHPLEETETGQIKDSTPSPRDRADERFQFLAIEAAVARLKPMERAAVILRLFEERPYKEIAQVMGKPEGSVKSMVSRAERKLRRHLQGLQK